MEKLQENKLEEIKKNLPKVAYGVNTNMYNIALEGWRRGLKVKFYNRNIKGKVKVRYSLTYKEREHKFSLSLGDTVPKSSTRFTRDKELTKKHLSARGIPVPEGKGFTFEHSDEEIIQFAKTLGYPLVIKPTNGSLGKGVTTNINDEKSITKALKYVREELGYDEVIVERYVTGEDTRVVVLNNKVIAAFKRISSNVIGNGYDNIEQLIELKNNIRRAHPHTYRSTIKINDELLNFLKEQGYTLDSIPNNGERVFLSSSKTIVTGGADTVDVTDKLSPKAKTIAVEATKSIPGMVLSGIDIMIDYKDDKVYVLEINSRPNLTGVIFPLEGKGRDVPKAIVDYYFPETSDNSLEYPKNKLYFDYEQIIKTLKSGNLDEVIVRDIPNGNLISKKIIVFGKVQGVGLRRWIQRKARNLELNGYVKNQNNKNRVLVVVAGLESNYEKLLKLLRSCPLKRAEIKKIKEQEWTKAVTMGFKIKKPSVSKVYKKKLEGEREKNRVLSESYRKLEKQLKDIRDSKSWKITSPLRKIVKYIKNT